MWAANSGAGVPGNRRGLGLELVAAVTRSNAATTTTACAAVIFLGLRDLGVEAVAILEFYVKPHRGRRCCCSSLGIIMSTSLWAVDYTIWGCGLVVLFCLFSRRIYVGEVKRPLPSAKMHYPLDRYIWRNRVFLRHLSTDCYTPCCITKYYRALTAGQQQRSCSMEATILTYLCWGGWCTPAFTEHLDHTLLYMAM